MTQNIYDNEAFFQNYMQLERSKSGLAGAPEWPELCGLLPNLSGKSVLDLGCGLGWFSRYAMEKGAASVLGLDVSQKMIAGARGFPFRQGLHYEVADLNDVQLEKNRYDLVFSSLTFHYIVDLKMLMEKIFAALKPQGRLVFSIEHPIFMAPSNPQFIQTDGQTIWPLNNYFIEGTRITDWLAPDVIKYHRTVSSIFNALVSIGFHVDKFVEWFPDETILSQHPEWQDELNRPMFLLMAAQKKIQE